MANLIYVTIKGEAQGLLSSGCSTYSSIGSMGNKFQSAHKDQIMVLSFDHELGRAKSGEYLPVSFVKNIDKSSPMLGIAMSNHEELELVFDFYRTTATGVQENYYSIVLKKAYIVKLHMLYPHVEGSAGSQPEEMLDVSFQDISCKHLLSGTASQNLWNGRPV